MTLYHFHKESDPLCTRSSQSSDLSQANIANVSMQNFRKHDKLLPSPVSGAIQSTCPCLGKYYLNVCNLHGQKC